MKEQTNKLKPCPFCGSVKVFIGSDENHDGVPCNMGRTYYYVWCSKCGGETSRQDDFTEAEAIARWNRRVCDE